MTKLYTAANELSKEQLKGFPAFGLPYISPRAIDLAVLRFKCIFVGICCVFY